MEDEIKEREVKGVNGLVALLLLLGLVGISILLIVVGASKANIAMIVIGATALVNPINSKKGSKMLLSLSIIPVFLRIYISVTSAVMIRNIIR